MPLCCLLSFECVFVRYVASVIGVMTAVIRLAAIARGSYLRARSQGSWCCVPGSSFLFVAGEVVRVACGCMCMGFQLRREGPAWINLIFFWFRRRSACRLGASLVGSRVFAILSYSS